MQDAKYFREQAQFCLEMARLMSDRQSAIGLKAQAAHYQQRALDLEAAQPAEDRNQSSEQQLSLVDARPE